MKEPDALLIGELSKKSGLTRDTLRFYEKEGILQSKRLGNNYRAYGLEELARLRFVENARASGFSLRETRQIMKMVRLGRKSCTDYEQVAHSKLKDLDEKIAALRECREILANSLRCCGGNGGSCDALADILP